MMGGGRRESEKHGTSGFKCCYPDSQVIHDSDYQGNVGVGVSNMKHDHMTELDDTDTALCARVARLNRDDYVLPLHSNCWANNF